MSSAARCFEVDALRVEVHPDVAAAGAAMARAVAEALRRWAHDLPESEPVGAAFASAPSQDAFLAALVRQRDVPWPRVAAFHLDEYLGLAPEHPSSFAHYLQERLVARVPLGRFEPLRADGDPAAAARRYAALLAATPLRVGCLGIGENGHLAFNDPHVADPGDPEAVKLVDLDLASRQQQLHDGTFPRLEDVPTHALTLTLPSLLAAEALHVVVPGPRKAEAVRRTLREPVGSACPATYLRRHARATLYLDEAAAALL